MEFIRCIVFVFIVTTVKKSIVIIFIFMKVNQEYASVPFHINNCSNSIKMLKTIYALEIQII